MDINELMYSDEYADYIMINGTRICCNGDMLLGLMEEGYLFDEFIEYKREIGDCDE